MCDLIIEDLHINKAMDSMSMSSVRGGQAVPPTPGAPQGTGMPEGTAIPDPMSMVSMPEGGPADFSGASISSWIQQQIGAAEQSYLAQYQPAPTQ